MQVTVNQDLGEGTPAPLVATGEARETRAQWLAIFTGLLVVAMLVGCANFSASGPLWPDAAQYANAGAMVHDWLHSGAILHPYDFAKQNYARYPGFHLPYHPPAYPVLLGVFFSFTGVSYKAVRIFIALCLWIAGCFFCAILRKSGIGRLAAIAGALLLLTTPEIALWSRDSMSEIPGLALLLGGAWFFMRWLASGSYRSYLLAFVFADAAFFSRLLTAGVLPAWFVTAGFAGKVRRLTSSAALMLPPIVYNLVNAAWVLFAQRWSRNETGSGPVGPIYNYSGPFSWKVVAFYASRLPAIVGWFLLVLAIIGLFVALGSRSTPRWKYLWPSWLVSYCVFIWVVGIYDEQRYLMYALPAFAGLAACVLNAGGKLLTGYRRYLPHALFCLCLAENVYALVNLPQGVVGLEAAGAELAGLPNPGNILVYSVEQAHLMFQYRAHNTAITRSFIRGDRSLAIRAPGYTAVKPEFLVHAADDVLDVVRRGRIRYIVTSPVSGLAGKADPPQELTLLNALLNSRRDMFRKIRDFPLLVQYSRPGAHQYLSLWEYTGNLPDGPSEIPIWVPTAEMVIQPTH